MPSPESAAELARACEEQPVWLAGPHGALVGVFTPPAPGVPATGLCAVLFTRPRAHRNRFWVVAARRLAARGVAAFRFDYHGLGDSEGTAGFQDPGAPYVEDADAVLRHLRAARGHTRFALAGACFDARTALAAFRDHAASIAGLVFVAAPVMTLPVLEQAAFGPPGQVLPLDPAFEADFARLLGSEARALFLYGEDDAEYASFRVAQAQLLAPLEPAVRRRFDVRVWPGAVHGFLEVARQREALEAIVPWIGALASAPPPA